MVTTPSLKRLRGWRQRYQSFRPFSEPEAWALFKLAAIAEAVGWTLLIIGVFSRDQLLHGNNAPVAIAGQIHGTLFIAYIIAVVVVAPSLGWSLKRTLLAGLCSVPPYGSLMYEQLVARGRSRRQVKHLYALVCYYSSMRTPLVRPV